MCFLERATDMAFTISPSNSITFSEKDGADGPQDSERLWCTPQSTRRESDDQKVARKGGKEKQDVESSTRTLCIKTGGSHHTIHIEARCPHLAIDVSPSALIRRKNRGGIEPWLDLGKRDKRRSADLVGGSDHNTTQMRRKKYIDGNKSRELPRSCP